MERNYDTPIKLNKPTKSTKSKNVDPDLKIEDQEPGSNNQELTYMFNELTSDLYVVGVKLKGFHWNIIGDQFFPLHDFLGDQVDCLFDLADTSAEIVRQINDEPAPVSMAEMVRRSSIAEVSDSELVDADDLVPVVLQDYDSIIKNCKSVVKFCDANNRQDLSDFAIKVMQFCDKYKWQFKSANK